MTVVAALVTFTLAASGDERLVNTTRPEAASVGNQAIGTPAASPAGRPSVGTVHDQLVRQQEAFPEVRLRIMKLLSAHGIGQGGALGDIRFDPVISMVQLTVESSATTKQGLSDAAWDVTRSLADLWAPGALVAIPNTIPGLGVIVNKTEFDCPWSFMAKLGAAGRARSSWETQCRQVEFGRSA